jgi:hypothetical protein
VAGDRARPCPSRGAPGRQPDGEQLTSEQLRSSNAQTPGKARHHPGPEDEARHGQPQPGTVCKTSIPGSNPGGASKITNEFPCSGSERHRAPFLIAPKWTRIRGVSIAQISDSQALVRAPWTEGRRFGEPPALVATEPPGNDGPPRLNSPTDGDGQREPRRERWIAPASSQSAVRPFAKDERDTSFFPEWPLQRIPRKQHSEPLSHWNAHLCTFRGVSCSRPMVMSFGRSLICDRDASGGARKRC